MKLKQEGRITYSELYGYVMENMRKVMKAKKLPAFGVKYCFDNLEDCITMMELHSLSLVRLREMAYKYGDQFL